MMTLLSEWERERKDSVCNLLLHHAIMVSGDGGIPSAFYLDHLSFPGSCSGMWPCQSTVTTPVSAQGFTLHSSRLFSSNNPMFLPKSSIQPLKYMGSVQSPVLTLHTRREDTTLACRSPGLRSPPRCLCHSSPPQTLEQLCEPEILASITL